MRKWICNYLFLLFFLLFGFSIQLYAAPPDPPKRIALGDFQSVRSYIDKLIRYWMDEDDIAGLSIAVLNKNKPVWQQGFGYSDSSAELAATSETVYRLGAISNIFTACVILRLSELGKLALDDDIAQYFPNLQFQYHDKKKYRITIRDLLTHHAGLPISRLEGSWTDQESDIGPLLAQLNHSYASYPPKMIFAYSNIGYSLLALIVERVTQKTFAAVLQEYVLGPLNMKDTDIHFSSTIKAKLAKGYHKGEQKRLLFPRDKAALGIYSNVRDMSYFLKMLLKQSQVRVISAASIDSMFDPQNENNPLDLEKRVGLGVMIGGMNVEHGGGVVWRSGTTLAYRAQMALLPDQDIAVILLSNDSRSWKALDDISERVLQLMLQATSDIRQDEIRMREDKDKNNEMNKSGILLNSYSDQGRNPVNTPIPTTSGDDVKAKFSETAFADSYTSFLGYIPLKKTANKIIAKLLGWPLLVEKTLDGWYSIKYDLFGFIPIDISLLADIKVRPAIIEKKKVLIAQYKTKQYLVGYSFSFNKLPSSWRKRQGSYKIINSDGLLEYMEIKQGKLVVLEQQLFFLYDLPNWFGLTLQIPLQTLSTDVAIIPGLGTALNETIQIKRKNKKEYLEYSGYLLEKIDEEEPIFDFF